MATYDPVVLTRLVVGEALGLGASFGATVLAAGESLPLTYTALGATLVFTAVLVRQVSANQKVYLDTVAGKDYEKAYADWQHRRDRWEDAERLNEARWENEHLRYTYGERTIDPGPYVPRPRPADLDRPPPRPGETQEPTP
jgi:hypothetical protein